MNKFRPTWCVLNICDIQAEWLKTQGIQCVCVDLDNTVLPWNSDTISHDVTAWIEQLKQSGLSVVIVSNNTRKRVEGMAQLLGCVSIANARKPFNSGLKKLWQEHYPDISRESFVMIGDQLFTDVLGGWSSGFKTILVKPIGESDRFATKMTRYVEKKALRYMQVKYNLEWR